MSFRASTISQPEQEKDEFYGQLHDVIFSMQHNNKLGLMGGI